MKRLLLSLLVVIYTPSENTDKITVFQLREKEPLIEVVCAEGVSYNECQGLDKPQERKEVISYEDIQNYVMRGIYSF